MTGEFSRRSFLKYTALTAVVVAGSSLLTGCGGDAPVQRAVFETHRPVVHKDNCTYHCTSLLFFKKRMRQLALPEQEGGTGKGDLNRRCA